MPQKQPFRCILIKRCSNFQQIYNETLMPKGDFGKVAEQLYWNHNVARVVFFCKFAAKFQNTFLKQHLWRAALYTTLWVFWGPKVFVLLRLWEYDPYWFWHYPIHMFARKHTHVIATQSYARKLCWKVMQIHWFIWLFKV